MGGQGGHDSLLRGRSERRTFGSGTRMLASAIVVAMPPAPAAAQTSPTTSGHGSRSVQRNQVAGDHEPGPGHDNDSVGDASPPADIVPMLDPQRDSADDDLLTGQPARESACDEPPMYFPADGKPRREVEVRPWHSSASHRRSSRRERLAAPVVGRRFRPSALTQPYPRPGPAPGTPAGRARGLATGASCRATSGCSRQAPRPVPP